MRALNCQRLFGHDFLRVFFGLLFLTGAFALTRKKFDVGKKMRPLVWTAGLFSQAFPFALLVALTGFEILVSALQAFIFTILTGVYIGLAMHPEH